MAQGLSELKQKLCQHCQQIEIRGKRNGNTGHAVFSALVSHRRACGVSDGNPFFFARAEAETHLRGPDAIRRIAKKCGAKHPETLSSIKLRKQVSTLSTVLNLKDNELDMSGSIYSTMDYLKERWS